MEGKGDELSCPLGASDHAGSTQSTQTISFGFVDSSFTQLTASPRQQLCPPFTQSRLRFPRGVCRFLLLGSRPVPIGPSPTLAVPGHRTQPGGAVPCVLSVALCSALGQPATSASQLLLLLQLSSRGEGRTEPTACHKVPAGVGAAVTHQWVLGLHQSRPCGTAEGCSQNHRITE